MTMIAFDGAYLSTDSRCSAKAIDDNFCSECDDRVDFTYIQASKLTTHRQKTFRGQTIVGTVAVGHVGVSAALRLAVVNEL